MAQRYDQKQFLDLLQTYKSEDTKKARRNLSLIGFLIVTAWVLGIQLTELRVFGADLRASSEARILIMAFLMLMYWGGMLFLSYRRDTEIQKEREIQLNVAVEQVFKRWNAIEESHKQAQEKGLNHRPSDYGEVKRAVIAYEQQQERTLKAKKYGNLIRALELYVPIIIGCSAAIVLAARMWRLFQQSA